GSYTNYVFGLTYNSSNIVTAQSFDGWVTSLNINPNSVNYNDSVTLTAQVASFPSGQEVINPDGTVTGPNGPIPTGDYVNFYDISTGGTLLGSGQIKSNGQASCSFQAT